jgi:hypothetical protein
MKQIIIFSIITSLLVIGVLFVMENIANEDEEEIDYGSFIKMFIVNNVITMITMYIFSNTSGEKSLMIGGSNEDVEIGFM